MATHAEGNKSKMQDLLPTNESELFNAFAAIQAGDGVKPVLTTNIPYIIKEEPADDYCQTVEEYIKNRTVSPSAFFGARIIISNDPEEFDERGPPNVNLPVIENLDKNENKKSFMEKMRAAMRITQLFPRRIEMDTAIAESQFIEEIDTTDWCHIHYYEFGERVGEIFKAISPSVIIDGLCAPSDATRLCLGAVGNPNRDPVAVASRRQIGRGCKLIYQEGNVIIESMSDAAIFIQSPIHAKSRNDHLATVYRLPAGHRMEVFNSKLFTQLLEHAKISNDFNQIYYLQTMCHVRMSFVKGWGERYRRQQITSTPCWVELHLPDPLKAVDFTLKQVLGPTNEVHSDT
uniref:MH2 domain-containing protein n=1 Tax=Panagrolaimus superbus TaxID=310955 RepID=A0A914YUE0_9BILA